MKTIIPMITIAAGLLVAAQSAQAASLKDTYCGGETYFGKTPKFDGKGGKYPHLHCHQNWIVYSANAKKHNDIADGNGVDAGSAQRACELADGKYADRIIAKIGEICQANLGHDCGC